MKAKKHSAIWNIFLVIFICLNLVNINAGRFDGESPTETVEVTETPEENDPPVETTPPVPVETEETPLVETALTEEPSTEDAVATEEPPIGEPVTDGEANPEEDGSVAELLSEVPDNTDIVVLDENGETVSLAEQEAADIILEEDPMWCPAGVLPGGAGCSANYSNISSLINNMRSNTGAYNEDGIIYFTSGNTNASFSLTTSSLGNSDFNTLNDFNLTLLGGWNGANGGSATFTGITNFGSNTLTIGTSGSRWEGNISLNNFSFSGVTSNNAITVYTNGGDITLDNINVSQQGGDDYTAYLNSNSGDITVEDSSFDGNNSGNNQNRGFRAQTNTGSISVTDTSFSDARGCTRFLWWCIDALTNYDGATLNAPTVTLTNVTANGNDLSGIQISNANTVTLNNVTATNNGTLIWGSGVDVNGTGSTLVSVNGGTFSYNSAYGVDVSNGAISVLANPTCTGNNFPGPDPSGCYNILPLDTTPPVLNLPADITVEATGPSGATASYTASATDNRDGIVPVSCSPSSGSTFPLGPTSVNCSATDNAGNTSSGSFNVTVQDTTPPVIDPHESLFLGTSRSQAQVHYSPPATYDIVDGAGVATCTPAPGSMFGLGLTVVTCTAIDSAGNVATPVTFTITIDREQSSKGVTSVIPVTGGRLFDISCIDPAIHALLPPGAKITFVNLCGYQAIAEEVLAIGLPGKLPGGASYVNGIAVSVFQDGKSANPLPNDASILLGLPTPAGSEGEYAILYWDGSEWVELDGQNNANGFVDVSSNQTGTFILVAK